MSSWYRPLELLNLPELYLANPLLWDSFIFLLLFLGLTQFVFVKGRDGRSGIYGPQKHSKFVSISIALILTFSMVLFEYYTGWYIGRQEVALLPLIILFLILLYFLYSLFESMFEMGKPCSASLAYLITYPALQAMFNFPLRRLSAGFELFQAFLTILILIAIITLIMCIVKFFRGADWGESKSKKSVDPWPGSKKSGSDNKNGGNGDKEGNDKNGDLKVVIESPRDKEEFEQDKPKSNPSIPFKATVSGGSGKFTYIIQYQRIERDSDVNTKLDTRWFGLEERKRVRNKSITRMITELGHEGTRGHTVFNLKVIVKDGKQEASAPVRVVVKMKDGGGGRDDEDAATATIKGEVLIGPTLDDAHRAKKDDYEVFVIDSDADTYLVDKENKPYHQPTEKDGTFTIKNVPVGSKKLTLIGLHKEDKDMPVALPQNKETFTLAKEGIDGVLLFAKTDGNEPPEDDDDDDDDNKEDVKENLDDLELVVRPSEKNSAFRTFSDGSILIMKPLIRQDEVHFDVFRQGKNNNYWISYFLQVFVEDTPNGNRHFLTREEFDANNIVFVTQRSRNQTNEDLDTRFSRHFSESLKSFADTRTVRINLGTSDDDVSVFDKLGYSGPDARIGVRLVAYLKNGKYGKWVFYPNEKPVASHATIYVQRGSTGNSE